MSGSGITIGIESIAKGFNFIKGVFVSRPFKKRDLIFHRLGTGHCIGKPTRPSKRFEHNSAFGLLNFPPVYRIEASSKKISRKKQPPNIKELDDFFLDALCEFDYKYTTTKNLDESGEEVVHECKLPKDVVKGLIVKLNATNKPQTVVVDGKIGCGKSTFLAAVMRELVTDPENSKYFPIRFDLREDMKDFIAGVVAGEYENDNEITSSLSEKFNRVLGYKLKQAGIDAKAEQSIEEKLSLLYVMNKSPVIIIDELDYVYYDFCCASMDANAGIKQDQLNERYIRIINYFLSLAANECVSGTYVNNTMVFVAARTSTLKLLEDIKQDLLYRPHTNVERICHRVRINLFNDERINEIIIKRLEYSIKRARRSINGDAQEYIKNLSRAVTELKKKEISFEKNLILSVHGFRHLMKILSRAEECDPSGALLSYYLIHPNLMRIYQYIDGCVDYSQTLEGVSNVFLVNRDFKIAQIRDNQVTNNSIPESLISDHLQTYWLKYFIMYYVKCIKDSGKECTTSDVIKIFCHSEGNANWQYFEKEIVHLILLHATEVMHGRLLKLGADSSSTDTLLIPSSRMTEILKRDLFWEFSYLFVIIEDEWLTLPKSIFSDFILNEKWQRTYNFITKFPDLSDEQKYKFVKYKAILVLKFLAVLEQSFDEEFKRCESAFRNFTLFCGTGTSIDDYIKERRIIVMSSIVDFTESYISDAASDNIKNEMNKFMKENYEKYIKIIKKDYKKYNSSGVTLTNMAGKMQKYYKERRVGPDNANYN